MTTKIAWATTLLLLAAFFGSTSGSQHGRHVSHIRRHAVGLSGPLLERGPAANRLTSHRRRSCTKKKSASSTRASSTAKATVVPAAVEAPPPRPSKTASPAHVGGSPNSGPPPHWPTKTQAGPAYSAMATSPSDPLLLSVSEALNNKENPLFTQVHYGELTYYGQGLGACGDTYDDSSYTAAISEHLYDSWPGANGQQNRNAVCGPFTPGRSILSNAGTFDRAVKSSVGSILIGGDGQPNCDPAPGSQCHIPLTATITNPATGKSVVVKIVDRCVACAIGDIDVTPTVFAKIADMGLGRVPGIHWQFNNY